MGKSNLQAKGEVWKMYDLQCSYKVHAFYTFFHFFNVSFEITKNFNYSDSNWNGLFHCFMWLPWIFILRRRSVLIDLHNGICVNLCVLVWKCRNLGDSFHLHIRKKFFKLLNIFCSCLPVFLRYTFAACQLCSTEPL